MASGLAGMAGQVVADARGLRRVCGTRVALGWLARVGLNIRACARRRNLAPADVASGDGPMTLRHNGHAVEAAGPNLLTGVREMWVRESYLSGGFLSVDAGAVVLDLGSNRGLFTLMALTSAADVRCVAVEASAKFHAVSRANIARNGFEKQAVAVRAFVGEATDYQKTAALDPDYADAEWITPEALVVAHGLVKIDLLKCDIEGSEFTLLMPDGKPGLLIGMARQLAIELHDFAGDPDAFETMLWAEGFEVRHVKLDKACRTIQARRTLQS